MFLIFLLLIASVIYSVFVTIRYVMVRNALIELDKLVQRLLGQLEKFTNEDWGEF